MADRYIINQKHIIRRRIIKFLPTFFVVLFLVSIIFGVVLWAALPVPSAWKSEDITIIDIQYRKKPRGYARYSSGGYELTDENGNLYWVAGELTWPQEGKTYSITYAQKSIYRRLKAVSHNGEVLKALDSSIAAWEQDSGVFLLILLCCTAVYIRLFIQLYKELHHPEILECKKRIHAYEEKMQKRMMKKRLK